MKYFRTLLPCMLLLMLVVPPVSAFAEPQVVERGERQSQVTRSIPYKQEDTLNGEFVGNALVTLVFLLAIATGMLYLVRRYMPAVSGDARAGSAIEVIQSRRLTPKLSLFLIRVRGHEVLLAQSGDALMVVGEGYEQGGPVERTATGE